MRICWRSIGWRRGSIIVNLGSGTGHSVLQVIEAVRARVGTQGAVSHLPAPSGRRGVLVASSERAKRELGWRPRFADLDEIVRTALLWREAHPNGYGD